MTAILFALEIAAFVVVVAWIYRNAAAGVHSSGKGLLAMKEDGLARQAPRAPTPRWKQGPARSVPDAPSPMPEWRRTLAPPSRPRR